MNNTENKLEEKENEHDHGDAERGKSVVANEGTSRRNYWPLIVLVLILVLGGLIGLLLYKQHAAGKEASKTAVSGTASSKAAVSSVDRRSSESTKKLGADGEDEYAMPPPAPVQPQVPAIARDYKPIPLQKGGKESAPPRSRFDSPSSFDAPPGQGRAPRSSTNTTPRPDYSVPPTAGGGAAFAAQPYDKSALNLSTLKTPVAMAAMIGNRNFILPKGAFIDCDLDTAINSTVPGMVRCTVTKDAWSDNGRVVLVGRGSTVTGEYRSDLNNGQARIQVIWNRIKTPEGVVIEPASPASDSLGRGGVDGDVDNHWFDRLGAAFLTSIVKDVIGYATVKNSGDSNTSNSVYQNTTQSGEQMSTAILKQTVNIPPTITRNQGTRIKVYLARDLDFSKVYTLKVVP